MSNKDIPCPFCGKSATEKFGPVAEGKAYGNLPLGNVNQTMAQGLIGRANTSFKEFSSKEMVYPEQD